MMYSKVRHNTRYLYSYTDSSHSVLFRQFGKLMPPTVQSEVPEVVAKMQHFTWDAEAMFHTIAIGESTAALIKKRAHLMVLEHARLLSSLFIMENKTMLCMTSFVEQSKQNLKIAITISINYEKRLLTEILATERMKTFACRKSFQSLVHIISVRFFIYNSLCLWGQVTA